MVSLIHEFSERYSGTSPRIRDVPTEQRGTPPGGGPRHYEQRPDAGGMEL